MESNEHKVRKWSCVFCRKSFQYFSHLSRHILYHIGEKPYFCKFCDLSFIEKPYLTDHRIVRHPKSLNESGRRLQKKFKCSTCDQVFAKRRYLTNHQLTHKRKTERPFKCDQCPATFTQSRYLQKHKSRHENKNTLFECQKCGELLRRTMLGNHVLQCQPEMFKKKTTTTTKTGNQLKLKNNPKATETKGQAEAHRDEEIQFLVCGICDEKFGNEVELTEHQRSHCDLNAGDENDDGDDDHDHATNDGIEMKIREMKEGENQDATVTTVAVTKKEMKKGRKKIKYKCLFCPAKFRAMATLEIHFETVHKGNVELDYDEDENDDLNQVQKSSPSKPKKRRLTTDGADLRGHED